MLYGGASVESTSSHVDSVRGGAVRRRGSSLERVDLVDPASNGTDKQKLVGVATSTQKQGILADHAHALMQHSCMHDQLNRLHMCSSHVWTSRTLSMARGTANAGLFKLIASDGPCVISSRVQAG